MQTLSPTVRNKMRIIYTAHSKYQSSEIKKETHEIAMDGLRGALLGQKKQVPFMQATKHIRGGTGRGEASSFPASVCPFGIGRLNGGGNAKTITLLAARRCLVIYVLINCSYVSKF